MSMYELARNSITASVVLGNMSIDEFNHRIDVIKYQRDDHDVLAGYVCDASDLDEAYTALAIAVYDITKERAQDAIEAALKAKDLYKAYRIYHLCLNAQNGIFP